MPKNDPIPDAISAAPILVVDDNADSAEMLTMALSAVGFDARFALDGRSALALAETFQPLVALLDLVLPDIDGYELARRLRRHPTLHAMKLIAVSGFGPAQDKTAGRDTEFDLRLVKPVDLGELVRMLNRFCA